MVRLCLSARTHRPLMQTSVFLFTTFNADIINIDDDDYDGMTTPLHRTQWRQLRFIMWDEILSGGTHVGPEAQTAEN